LLTECGKEPTITSKQIVSAVIIRSEKQKARDLHLQISGFEKTLQKINVLNLVLDYDGRFILHVVG
jgi:hypothetical protein